MRRREIGRKGAPRWQKSVTEFNNHKVAHLIQCQIFRSDGILFSFSFSLQFLALSEQLPFHSTSHWWKYASERRLFCRRRRAFLSRPLCSFFSFAASFETKVEKDDDSAAGSQSKLSGKLYSKPLSLSLKMRRE